MPATAPRQTHRRQAHKLIADLPQTSGKSHLFCLCHLTDSCSHKNIRRRWAAHMHFVAVVTTTDRESWIQFNFYDLTPTVLQSQRRICVSSATYVHICRKALATISQTRRRHDCIIYEPRQETLITLYWALIHPYLNYGIANWGQSSKSLFNKLLRLQKRVLRLIFFKK